MSSPRPEPDKTPLEVCVRRIHRRDLNRTWEFLKLVLPGREPRDGRVPAPALEAALPRGVRRGGRRAAPLRGGRPDRRLRGVRVRTRAATTAGSTCATSRSAACGRCSSRSWRRTPTIRAAASARFMLEQLQHLARVRGCTHLVLEVAENNEDALRWYRGATSTSSTRRSSWRRRCRDRARAAAAAQDRRPPRGRGSGRSRDAGRRPRRSAAIRETGFVVLPDVIPHADLDGCGARSRRSRRRAATAATTSRGTARSASTRWWRARPIFAALVEHPLMLGAVRRVPRAQLPADGVAGDQHPAGRDAAAVPHRRLLLPHRATARRRQPELRSSRSTPFTRGERCHPGRAGKPSLGGRRDRSACCDVDFETVPSSRPHAGPGRPGGPPRRTWSTW